MTMNTLLVALALPSAIAYDPWPLPLSYSFGTTAVSIGSSLSFTMADDADPLTSPILAAAFKRYAFSIPHGFACSSEKHEILDRLRNSEKKAPAAVTSDSSSNVLSVCTVTVTDQDELLGEGTDESYSLNVAYDGTCTLSSETVPGALRGLESLSQLAGEACLIENAPVQIADAPRFGYRGLMVDSSRHFLPMASLERIIDAMVALKFNVLHWHLSDSQSFPSESKVYPLLAQNGAWLWPEAAYSIEQMQGLVAYAQQRGVRVMPEWDIPGHGSWGKGYPDIMVTDGPCDDTLDPTNDDTYTFLLNFLTEMVGYFPDQYLFLGGDEVASDCFTESPSVSAWMAENNVNSSAALQAYFWQQVSAQVLPSLNRTLGVWIADDGIPNPVDLPAGSFGDVWQSQEQMKPVIAEGGRVVLSGPWYLDMQAPGNYTTYNLKDLWKGMYTVEPYDNLDADEQAMVIGGQACMWSEGANKWDFEGYAITKAAAVAERLWSAQDVNSVTNATGRLEEMVCRLNMRGIAAEAINPNFCLSDLA